MHDHKKYIFCSIKGQENQSNQLFSSSLTMEYKELKSKYQKLALIL